MELEVFEEPFLSVQQQLWLISMALYSNIII
jgi:hypothetical protein